METIDNMGTGWIEMKQVGRRDEVCFEHIEILRITKDGRMCKGPHCSNQ